MTAEENIKGLAHALARLYEAVAKSHGSFTLPEAGRINDALDGAFKAQTDHQTWLLSERR